MTRASESAAKRVDWLTHKVRPMFAQRVLRVSEDVMFKCRLLVEDGRKHGHTFSQPNLIIGATALEHGLTVVTRDHADYDRARVPVKQECLRYIVPLGEHHLRAVVHDFVEHYHAERNHQGLGNVIPFPSRNAASPVGRIGRSERLGGVLAFYERSAA